MNHKLKKKTQKLSIKRWHKCDDFRNMNPLWSKSPSALMPPKKTQWWATSDGADFTLPPLCLALALSCATVWPPWPPPPLLSQVRLVLLSVPIKSVPGYPTPCLSCHTVVSCGVDLSFVLFILLHSCVMFSDTSHPCTPVWAVNIGMPWDTQHIFPFLHWDFLK